MVSRGSRVFGRERRHNLAQFGARDMLFPLMPLQRGRFHLVPTVFAQERVKRRECNIDIINFQDWSPVEDVIVRQNVSQLW